MQNQFLNIPAFVFFLLSTVISQAQSLKIQLIDAHATKETNALHRNLNWLSEKYILFGHQHATEYGHGWLGDENRSDVKSVTGSHPAIIGVDFGSLSGQSDSIIEKEKTSLRKYISETYNRGGITTVSWHFNNPVSKTNFYWNDSTAAAAVSYIIPGGSHHEKYKSILKTIAALANSVKSKAGKLVPMIFRPYHEFDGDWFWWGKRHCTADEFKTLWRFTVSYLRDSLQVHNFIYAFSPDNKFETEEKYMERYPGNEWVDMVGMDNYGDFGRNGKYDLEAGYNKLKIVSDFAIKSGKLAAFTETGLESVPDTTWWTEKLLTTLKRSNLRLSYVLVWRNDSRSPTHYYAPFPGQVSQNDFLKFYNDPYTLFENDLKKIYKK
jgi:mannan endo-1,4-beta-mannosidase